MNRIISLVFIALFTCSPLAFALDYDQWGVWYCGVRDDNTSALKNLNTPCSDTYYHYTDPVYGSDVQRISEPTKIRSCYYLTKADPWNMCYDGSKSYCRGGLYVQCTPLLECPDNDGDGWRCCPKDNCIPNAAPTKDWDRCAAQDCLSSNPTSKYCSDGDPAVYPGSTPINRMLISLNAELDPEYKKNYDQQNYTNLIQPTILSGLKITLLSKYCITPLESFAGRLQVLINGANGDRLVSQLEGQFF